jgi:hypothetical protein
MGDGVNGGNGGSLPDGKAGRQRQEAGKCEL